MRCINCENKKLKKIVKIGTQPLSGVFTIHRNFF